MKLLYPYSYIYKKKRIYLIWQTSEENGDNFKLSDKNILLTAKTKEELETFLGEDASRVRWSEGFEINFDNFWGVIQNMVPGRASKKKTCELLLNGWNFIEDLLNTFDLKDELKALKTPILKQVYDKLFFGNNMPSITPSNRSYNPVWKNEEISLLRTELRRIWKILKDNGYILY